MFSINKRQKSEISDGLIDHAAYRIVNTRPSMASNDQWQSAQLIANSNFVGYGCVYESCL